MTSEQTSPADDRPVILLVEDEALTIMDLGDVLEDGGYETVQCASAERALSILQARPDICGLVTDVELSGKTNGFDLANSVAEARPQLPIVIVSGRASPDPDRMPAGAHFIARPCSGEEILDQLRRLMPC
ncbi:response regulator [Methylobacterium sp. A54F]